MASICKHIIWDWNGTLLNDTSLCVEVLNGLLTSRGLDVITPDIYRENFGFPVIDFYHWLGFDAGEKHFQELSREFIDNYEARWLEGCSLHRDTRCVLEKLSEQGLTHSVLSAAKQEALEIGINHFGISQHFTGLLGTDNIYAKGKVEQGRRWIEQLNWSPDEVVLVGDTLHDFEVASAIGSRCILLSHGHNTTERLATCDVPVVESLKELIDFLPNFQQAVS